MLKRQTGIRLVVTLSAIAALGLAVAAPRQPAAAAAPGPGHTVPWNGGHWLLLGANYPWLHYGNDFGSNAWGAYGVHADSTYDAQFADLATKGVHVARWWVFGDGRAGIATDASGAPTGLDSYVFQDLDRALAIAATHGIYLDLVLFDFGLLHTAQWTSGVQMGGHSGWLTDPARRSALIANVVQPTLSRYGANPRVMMWEIMNEPEWAISDLPQPAVNSDVVPMTQAQFWDFAARVAAAIHTTTGAYATVGSACLKWNKVWTNGYADRHALPRLNLDVYQTHYYPWMDPYQESNDPDLGTTRFSPLQQPYDALGLDHPLVVGELAMSAAADLDTLLANGYAGAWPWSYWGGDGISVPWTAFTSWEAAHAALVRIDGGSPAPTATATRTPTARSTSAPTVTPTSAPPTATTAPSPVPPTATRTPVPPTATPQPAAPILSGIIASPGRTSATISWTTDIPATSTVRYGAGGALTQTVTDPALTRSHRVTIVGLQRRTAYTYVVESAANGLTSASAPRTVTTR